MSGFSDLAAMVAITGERFRAHGLNPPRMVLTRGDFEKLRALIPPDYRDVYLVAEGAVEISGVKILAARER